MRDSRSVRMRRSFWILFFSSSCTIRTRHKHTSEQRSARSADAVSHWRARLERPPTRPRSRAGHPPPTGRSRPWRVRPGGARLGAEAGSSSLAERGASGERARRFFPRLLPAGRRGSRALALALALCCHPAAASLTSSGKRAGADRETERTHVLEDGLVDLLALLLEVVNTLDELVVIVLQRGSLGGHCGGCLPRFSAAGFRGCSQRQQQQQIWI